MVESPNSFLVEQRDLGTWSPERFYGTAVYGASGKPALPPTFLINRGSNKSYFVYVPVISSLCNPIPNGKRSISFCP